MFICIIVTFQKEQEKGWELGFEDVFGSRLIQSRIFWEDTVDDAVRGERLERGRWEWDEFPLEFGGGYIWKDVLALVDGKEKGESTRVAEGIIEMIIIDVIERERKVVKDILKKEGRFVSCMDQVRERERGKSYLY